MSGIPAGAGSLLGKRLGKYEILALLALGGTAEIYLARIGGASGFEKYVVIKCLHDHLADDAEFVKMFLDEARLAAVLDHSNIVQTFELGEHEHRYYMVMEFLAGLSLAMVVRRAAERVPGGRVPVPLILNIAAQAAAGLHYAHERTQGGKPLNMVHRDISPQNLVIGFEGVVKVVDFGIARAEYRETKTKAGTIKGKFAYMSPEQCVATNVDRRTDVFALGVIVHELLTGRRLFKRNSPYETYQAVIECAVPSPSTVNVEIDPSLDPVIMKAVAKDKDARYPTAEAFGDAMLGYLHHRGKGSGPGEIGRWFETHFQQEIQEHGGRMRELITGRDPATISNETGGEEAAGANRNETVRLRKTKEEDEEGELDLESGEIERIRPSEASLEHLIARLRTDSDDRDDREKTRIEANPLAAAKRPNHDEDAYKATMAHETQPPPAGAIPAISALSATAIELPADVAQAPTLAAPPIEPGPGPIPGPGDRIGAARATGDAVERTLGPRDAGPSPYPVVRGRPFGAELAPSAPPGSGPQAAKLMSPVGEGYPRRDWAAVAATPARALTRLQLGLLFVAVVAGAITLTMVVAKLLH